LVDIAGSMHFRMVTPWKGAKRTAGGESPRRGYRLAMRPGRGESLFRPMSHLSPLRAPGCSLIESRAHARGYFLTAPPGLYKGQSLSRGGFLRPPAPRAEIHSGAGRISRSGIVEREQGVAARVRNGHRAFARPHLSSGGCAPLPVMGTKRTGIVE
jgi:hypothetical protein